MNEIEYRTFLDVYKLLAWKVSQCFYIDVPVETCFERMKIRGRECEDGVSRQYLQNIEKKYKAQHKTMGLEGPVIVNGDCTPEEIAKDVLYRLGY